MLAVCVLALAHLLVAQQGSGSEQNPGQTPKSPPPSSSGSSTPDASTKQQPASTDQTKQVPDAPSHQKSQQEIEAQKEEQSYRVLGVVPMFGTTSRQNAKPLAPKEKFHLFVRSAFDPVVFVLVGAQAGISQATNSFEGYGQGRRAMASDTARLLRIALTAAFLRTSSIPLFLSKTHDTSG